MSALQDLFEAYAQTGEDLVVAWGKATESERRWMLTNVSHIFGRASDRTWDVRRLIDRVVLDTALEASRSHALGDQIIRTFTSILDDNNSIRRWFIDQAKS